MMKQSKIILKKWRARITKARKRGHFTDYEKELSYNWSKCAVGERDCMCEKVISKEPRVWENYAGYDIEQNRIRGEEVEAKMYAIVSKLGQNFNTFVRIDNFDKASITLKKIESIPKEKFYRK